MGVTSGCGEPEVGVASGSGWNLWVWLESMGVATGCGCKEVSPTSIIRTSDIRYLDYPDLRRASRDNRLWSRAHTRGPRF